jgi:hypothetical protein
MKLLETMIVQNVVSSGRGASREALNMKRETKFLHLRAHEHGAPRVSMIYPAMATLTAPVSSHRLELTCMTSLRPLKAALLTKAVEEQVLSKYPEHHVRQFLTAFSIPAFFRGAPD